MFKVGDLVSYTAEYKQALRAMGWCEEYILEKCEVVEVNGLRDLIVVKPTDKPFKQVVLKKNVERLDLYPLAPPANDWD